MSGWDVTRRVSLSPPWESSWVAVYLDPPLGDYLDMQAAAVAALADPSEATIDALVASIEPLIADHNLTNRDGSPLTWQARMMGGRMILALKDALQEVMRSSPVGGGTADPLPPRPSGMKPPATSRRRASRAKR